MFLLSAVFIFPASSSGFNNNNLIADGPANKLVQLVPQALPLGITGELQGILAHPDFAKLQKTIGYQFKDPELLILALRHSSFDKGHTASGRGNERLEFFGDAVLEHIMRDMLWHEFPHINNGSLRNTCAKLVTNKSLSLIAEMINLPGIAQSLKLSPQGVLDEKGKANFVEALIAAIHEDGGLDASKVFVRKYWRGTDAPQKLRSTFKQLGTELKALQSKRGGKVLTRRNYDKKYDDSLSFLGEGVLGFVLKNYLCREFLKEEEGGLHKKYITVFKVDVINQLCKALGLNEKHDLLKNRMGKRYLEDGLEKTAQYILRLWTSESAPDNIYNAFADADIPATNEKFLLPEKRSSFLAAGNKMAPNQLSLIVVQNILAPVVQAVAVMPVPPVAKPLILMPIQDNKQEKSREPISVPLQKKANKNHRAQELKATAKAAAKKRRAAQSAADLARNATVKKTLELAKKAAAQKASALAKNAAEQSAAAPRKKSAAQSAAALARNAEIKKANDLVKENTTQRAFSAQKMATIKQQKSEYLSESIGLLIDKGDAFFRSRWFDISYLAYQEATEKISVMDSRYDILEYKKGEAYKMMKAADDLKRGKDSMALGHYNEASCLFKNVMSNLQRDDPLYREAFYSNNEVNMLRVRNSIIMGHQLFNSGEHEIALDYYMCCLSKLENAPYHHYILHTEVLKAIDRTNKAIADKKIPVVDKIFNWFGSVFM